MNTADRSIALMDTVLRRRFEFIEVLPDTTIFKKINDDKILKVNDIDIKNMLDFINKRIEILYDREHTIGQSYFICLIEDNTIDKLSSIFESKIIPLLQEYFYDDYEKIRIVLGDNQVSNEQMQFIIKENIDSSIFGENFEMDFYDEKGIYKINKYALTSEKAYIKTMEYSEDELNG